MAWSQGREPQENPPRRSAPQAPSRRQHLFSPPAELHQRTEDGPVDVRQHAMESIRPALAALRSAAPRRAPRFLCERLHTSTARRATPLPHPSVPGPPPATPTPSPSDALARVARKREQAALLKQAQEARAAPGKPGGGLQRRFWKNVSVKETNGTQPALD